MSRTFWYASTFNEDISEWDVSSVTDMNGMFFMAGAFNQPSGTGMFLGDEYAGNVQWCGSFNQPIGNWDLSSVTNIRRMLRYASDFNQPIGNWDVSAVTKMDGMFFAAGAFDQPIGSWNVSLVTNMQEMFDGAASFNQPIGNWTYLQCQICIGYSGVPIHSIRISVTGMFPGPQPWLICS